MKKRHAIVLGAFCCVGVVVVACVGSEPLLAPVAIANDASPDTAVAVDTGTAADGATTDAAADATTSDALADVADAGCGDASTPDNCGRCGHSCLGGACVNLKCEPVSLAGSLNEPAGIAVHDSYVYVALHNDNRIVRVSKSGGTLLEIASQPGAFQPWGIAVDANGIYWTNGSSPGGAIRMCPLPGCGANAPALLYDGADQPVDITVSGSTIFWVEGVGGAVRRIDRDGGAFQTLVSDPAREPRRLVLDEQYVYFTDKKIGSIVRVPRAGGVPADEPIGTPAPAFGITLADAGLFWTIPRVGAVGDGLVQTAPKAGLDGGVPINAFASQQVEPAGIAIDDRNVYWINNGDDFVATGGVLYCPLTGCPASGPITLASNQHFPSRIALDDTAIYWTSFGTLGSPTFDGAIMKLAKP